MQQIDTEREPAEPGQRTELQVTADRQQDEDGEDSNGEAQRPRQHRVPLGGCGDRPEPQRVHRHERCGRGDQNSGPQQLGCVPVGAVPEQEERQEPYRAVDAEHCRALWDTHQDEQHRRGDGDGRPGPERSENTVGVQHAHHQKDDEDRLQEPQVLVTVDVGLPQVRQVRPGVRAGGEHLHEEERCADDGERHHQPPHLAPRQSAHSVGSMHRPVGVDVPGQHGEQRHSQVFQRPIEEPPA